jgi:magnesium-protoporphyrin IX monomethyl ester (oxidative) cyclase
MSRVDSCAHVVLVNPPALKGRTNERALSGGLGVSRRLKPFEQEAPALPPLDVLYLAAVAERGGARVTIIDLLLERLRGRHALRHCQARIPHVDDTVWIGVRLSMPSLDQDLRFAEALKAISPSARVFVFGAAIMATLDHWIADTRVDYVLYGEPEGFFADVLRAADPSTVPGVVAPGRFVPLTRERLFDRSAHAARAREWRTVPDLLTLPRPAWHLLDLSRYAPGGCISDLGVFVQASRGCPIGCTMCPYTLTEGETWRSSAIGAVVDELDYLNREFGIFRVRFRDANFGFSRRYARALADAIIARGVRLQATIETSLEVFDEETLQVLHRAGIVTITTGVETNDPACMQSIGQPLAVNDRLRARVEWCRRTGFHVYGTFCLGMPEETWESVESTWRFADELDIESGFTVLTPFPGTQMYWRALAEGLIPPRMQFGRWNSYSATARTYALTTTDLDMARWWARMETIVRYRGRRLSAGSAARLWFTLRHTPHYFWRQVCRTYVWWRRRAGPAQRQPPLASTGAMP